MEAQDCNGDTRQNGIPFVFCEQLEEYVQIGRQIDDIFGTDEDYDPSDEEWAKLHPLFERRAVLEKDVNTHFCDSWLSISYDEPICFVFLNATRFAIGITAFGRMGKT